MENQTAAIIVTGRHQDMEAPDNYYGSLVTDPPYGLKFMGKKWDYNVPSVEDWKSVFIKMKPGAYGAVFCGTRTQHRMVVNLEDAGFEIRDVIAWIYGSGFPKSMDIGKQFDKAAGAEREVIGQNETILKKQAADFKTGSRKIAESFDAGAPECNNGFVTLSADITAPATAEARQWDGWGNALKPAMELITLIRKPLQGTTIENIREYGVGALNIDVCRVPPTGESLAGGDTAAVTGTKVASEAWDRPWRSNLEALEERAKNAQASQAKGEKLGRFPANVIHDGSEEVVELFPAKAGAAAPVSRGMSGESKGIYGDYAQKGDDGETFYGDSGSAARFFYCAKASPSERNAGVQDKNKHPTVKPMALIQYLVRLITPPGEIVYDPYAGSGTTACASVMEGFSCVAIEQDPDNAQTAQERLWYWKEQAKKGIQLKIA